VAGSTVIAVFSVNWKKRLGVYDIAENNCVSFPDCIDIAQNFLQADSRLLLSLIQIYFHKGKDKKMVGHNGQPFFCATNIQLIESVQMKD
jgi:hypothetical protein